MIEISCKNLLQENDVRYTYYINLVEVKFSSNMKRIASSSSFTPCTNRENY